MRSLFSMLVRYRSALLVFVIGLVFFLIPYPLYFWSLSAGRLVAEEDWWDRGLRHGPWRQQGEAVFVVIPMDVLLLGALVLAVSTVGLALRSRDRGRLWAMAGVACCYIAFLVIQAKTVSWTVR